METDLRLVFALFAIPFGLFFGWPLVRRWLGEDDWLTASIATFGLSLGALSLWMFALSLVPRALSVWSILTLPAAVVVMTLAMGGRALAQGRRGAGTTLKSLTPDPSSIIPLLGVALPLAIITVNVLYYPFYYPDTLSRYGLFARRIFETRGLPESVQGYPLLVSLGYAWAFFAGGAVNDRLAGIVSAAFCAATIGVTFTLAREMYGRRAALAAAFLAATSTLFVVWGTSGYVDIPTGFFFALSALFAFRWLEGGPARNLWLAGLSSGLAIWTKQAGFIIVPSLVGVTVMSVLYPRGTGAADQRLSVPISLPLRDAARAGLIFIATITLVAGPWYLRNYLLSGPAAILPLPGSFYEAQADRRLVALFSFVTRPEEWGWTFALLGLFGLLYSLLEAVAGQWIGGTPEGRRRALFLLAFIVPYHLAWWWLFSYEARFLLTLLPFYAVLAGRFVDLILRQTHLRLPWPAAAIVCGAIAVAGVWPRLGAVYHLVREPLASEHDIRLRLRPEQTLVVDYLRSHLTSGGDSVLMMDGSDEYFLTDYRTGVFYPLTLADVQKWDYLIYPSWAPSLYAGLGHADSEFIRSVGDPAKFREVYRVPGEGVVVYQIVH